MNKEEILKVISEHPDSYPQIIKAHYKQIYKHVFENFQGVKFGEKLYRWIHEGETYGKCKHCGVVETRFESFIKGFVQYCCKKCSNNATIGERSSKMRSRGPDPEFWETKNCELCNELFSAHIFRKQRFCSVKCSTNFTANDENRLNKIKETKLERYGDEYYLNQEKMKQTCLEKYGVENAGGIESSLEKIKQTTLKHFGVEYSLQSEEVKGKIKETNLKRYGVENVSSAESVKQKRMKSLFDLYGVQNVFQIDEIKKKIVETNQERYGVNSPLEDAEILQKAIIARRPAVYERNKLRHATKVEFLFPVEEFKGIDRSNKYKFKCVKCNSEFIDDMDGNGHPRCMKCYPPMTFQSYAELEVLNYIKELFKDKPEIEILSRDRSLLKNRELDVYIPSYKLAIEYNGLFWHSELSGEKDEFYHIKKTNKCKELGVRLIHIYEDEWLNKKDIVKSKLKHILHLNHETTSKIYARKCEIREDVDFKVGKKFLEKNHIQGNGSGAPIRLGLYYQDNLVALMTFGRRRVALGKKKKDSGVDEYELLRFATSTNVIGGAGKLFHYFICKFKPEKITSYADLRYSDESAFYGNIGFKLNGKTDPNYYYFIAGYPERYHRFNFRKNVLKDKLTLFDANLTEWKNMQDNGWDRIWDCGHLRYEWAK